MKNKAKKILDLVHQLGITPSGKTILLYLYTQSMIHGEKIPVNLENMSKALTIPRCTLKKNLTKLNLDGIISGSRMLQDFSLFEYIKITV